jgi:hypothetical protein
MNTKTITLAIIFLFGIAQLYNWLVTFVSDSNRVNSGINDKLVFVHIGKTGGSTIQKFLKDNLIEHRLIHCHPVPSEVLHKDSKVLISIRDPIERITSAFNWRSPAGGGIYKLGKYNTPAEQSFYNCFPNVSSFIRIFSGANSSCRDLAQRALNGPEHIGMGYSFYLERVIALLSTVNVRVIRQRNLLSDLMGLEVWLGKKFHDRIVSQLRSSYYLHNSTTDTLATAQEIIAFRSVIAHEYEIYYMLLDLVKKHSQFL